MALRVVWGALCVVVLALSVVPTYAKIGIELEGGMQVAFADTTITKKIWQTVLSLGIYKGKKTYHTWSLPKPKSIPLAHVKGGSNTTAWGVKMDVDVMSAISHSHFELVSDPPTNDKAVLYGQINLMHHMEEQILASLGGAAKVLSFCKKQRKQPASATVTIATAPESEKLVTALKDSDYDTAQKLGALNIGLPVDHFAFETHAQFNKIKVGATRYDCGEIPGNSGEVFDLEPQVTAAFALRSIFKLFDVIWRGNTMFCEASSSVVKCDTFHSLARTGVAASQQLDASCRTPAVGGFISLVHYILHGTSKISFDDNPKASFGPLLVRTKFNSMFEQGLPHACKVWIRGHMDQWVTTIVSTARDIAKQTNKTDAYIFPEGVKLVVKTTDPASPYTNLPLRHNETFTRRAWIQGFSAGNGAGDDLLQSFRHDTTGVPRHAYDSEPIHPSFGAMFDVADSDKVGGEPVAVVELRKMRDVGPSQLKGWGAQVWHFVQDINNNNALTADDIAKKYKTIHKVNHKDNRKSVEQQVLEQMAAATF